MLGLRADPNGHSLLVSVWGMKKGEKEGSHEWVVITIDFSKILTKNCEAKDYVDWSPTTGGSSGCYLGEKFTYKVKKENELKLIICFFKSPLTPYVVLSSN